MITLDTYSLLAADSKVFGKVPKTFCEELRFRVRQKFGSLTAYAEHIGIGKHTLFWNFRRCSFPLSRLLRIGKELSMNDILSKIEVFHVWGSQKDPRSIPRYVKITEDNAQLPGLFYAEGDTHASKIIITNSEPSVILFTHTTLQKIFPDGELEVIGIIPESTKCAVHTSLDHIVTKTTYGSYNKIMKYRVIIYSSLCKKVLDRMNESIFRHLHKEQKIACAWAKGILAGEGTVRNGKERYMRVEMKDAFAIHKLAEVLEKQRIPHRVSERKDRPGMWVLYVGAKSLGLLRERVGFGCHTKRRLKLKQAAEKYA